mgnify:CR=1 FL=1
MNFPLCPRFQAVLFDMDGTLLDTLSDMQDAVNHILLENGWPQRTLEEIRAFVGNGAAKLMERAIPEPIAPQRFQEILSAYKDWYQAHNCVKTAPYPGIPEVLAELEAEAAACSAAVAFAMMRSTPLETKPLTIVPQLLASPEAFLFSNVT